MAVCFFDTNYEEKYRCEYELKDNHIEIIVEYDINKEIEFVNGIRSFGMNDEFRERDILIVDSGKKKNYLLKKAYYAGHTMVLATVDGGVKTKFRANIIFEHGDVECLCKLPVTPKISKIRVYSKMINDVIGHPKMETYRDDEEYVISLSKKAKEKSVDIGTRGIERLVVSEEWTSVPNGKTHNIVIDFYGFIELGLGRRVNYDRIYEFIAELKLYIQLFLPDKFLVDKVRVVVDNEFYDLFLPEGEFKHTENRVEKTVDEEFLIFLKKCYEKIPYRNSKTEYRNIPYIVLKTSRGIEDNFLMFYRFIECYYKKQQIPGIMKKFVTYSLEEHYAGKHSLTEEQVENYAQEIICLRNHFVHAGYYIKNSSMKICFDKINRRKNPRDYTVNGVDVRWIYDRTKILYEIVIDIIFDKMLGYSEYKFYRHF